MVLTKTEVRIELMKRGLTQLDLAKMLSVPPTTLASWPSGAHPGPANLAERIHKALAGVGVEKVGQHPQS